MQHLNLIAYQEWLHNLPDNELLCQLKIEFGYTPYPPPEKCDGLEAVLEECDKRHLDVGPLFREWMERKPAKKMARSVRPAKRCDWFGWKVFFIPCPSPEDVFRGWLVFENKETRFRFPVALTCSTATDGHQSLLLRSVN